MSRHDGKQARRSLDELFVFTHFVVAGPQGGFETMTLSFSEIMKK